MKKIMMLCIVGSMWILTLCGVTLQAASLEMTDNQVEVILTEEGDAKITQVIDLTASQGTEFYIGFLHSEYVELIDVQVEQDGEPLQETMKWPSNGTLEEKAGKYGVLDAGDKDEIVFGLGTYGEHQYEVKYTLTNIVRSYTDVDGFHTRFINENLSPAPEKASVRVAMITRDIPFSFENTKIWAFGYEGNIHFNDGVIEAKTTNKMNENNYVNIMASFEKGIFTPRISENKSFELVKEEAFVGSDYSLEDVDASGDDAGSNYYTVAMSPTAIGLLVLIGISVVGTLVGGIFYVIYANSNSKYYHKKYGMSVDKYVKEESKENYYREIPFNGDMIESLYALQEAGIKIEDTDILASILLGWVDNKNISIVEVDTKNLFGKEKKEAAIKFLNAPDEGSQSIYEMYTLLFTTADSNHVLMAKDVKKVTTKKGKQITKWKEKLSKEGEERMRMDGFIMDRRPIEKQSFGNEKYVLTETGVNEVIHLLELKNYLKDYSLINERKVGEVTLWKDYLLYASLLGIAVTVAKQFGQLMPSYFENDTYGNHLAYIRMSQNIQLLGASYNAGYQSYTANSGAGGSASFGGGGGFSGGGGGGGVR